MSARGTQEELLPELLERRRILERAGIVLAEARSLLEWLDQAEGKLNVRGKRLIGPLQRIVVGVPRPKGISQPTRRSSLSS